MPAREKHPLAGKTVRLKGEPSPFNLDGQEYTVEDWWINVAGRSWMVCDGNPACLMYAMRSGAAHLPTDNEVVYGHTSDGLGNLVHQSEIVVVEDEVDKPCISR
jgi:hypothetical protein